MQLNAQIRSILGKKTKKLRNEGLIPAELYGHNISNIHLLVNEKEFLPVYKKAGENTIIEININNEKKVPALIKDVNFHPLTQKILSIDFHQLRMDEKVETEIPIEFKGEPKAAKKGLMVEKLIEKVKISTMPDLIPAKFEIDITNLENPGDAVYVKDIKRGEKIKILASEDTILAIVTEEQKEENTEPVSQNQSSL